MNNTTMQCADEPGFPRREFHPDGEGDFTCAACGWMQMSFAAGLRELANCATWHDEVERARYMALAAAQTQSAARLEALPDSIAL